MKLKYLGTAAAEGAPAFFCNCDNCKRVALLGGKNIRTRSQAIIDGDLLIDYPSDTYWHFIDNNIDMLGIKNLLITHTHDDHIYAPDLQYTRTGFSKPPVDWHGVTVWGSKDLIPLINSYVKNSNGFFRYSEIVAFNTYTVGDYNVTPLKAYHGTENPFIYIVEKQGKSILYAHDTGEFPKETLEYLEKSNIKLNAVSLDCTFSNYEGFDTYGHQGIGVNKLTRKQLIEIGVADQNTKFILNHFSHNRKGVVYEDFLPIAQKAGFLVSYDGMEVEI